MNVLEYELLAHRGQRPMRLSHIRLVLQWSVQQLDFCLAVHQI